MSNTHIIWRSTLSTLLIGFIGTMLMTSTGCSTTVQDQSRTNQVRPDVRGPVEHGRLGSKELDNTTDVMLESIVDSLDDLQRNEDGQTVIIMDQMTNRSFIPTDDMEIFIAQLRRKLNQSGATYQIVFVENPDRAESVRNRVLEEGLKDDYETPGLRPNYALTGNLYAIEEAGARYWEIFFELLDLDPNAKYRNEIRWENSVGYRFAR